MKYKAFVMSAAVAISIGGAVVASHFLPSLDRLNYYRAQEDRAPNFAAISFDLRNAYNAMHRALYVLEELQLRGAGLSEEQLGEAASLSFDSAWSEAIFYFSEARLRIESVTSTVADQPLPEQIRSAAMANGFDANSYASLYIALAQVILDTEGAMQKGHDPETLRLVQLQTDKINSFGFVLNGVGVPN